MNKTLNISAVILTAQKADHFLEIPGPGELRYYYFKNHTCKIKLTNECRKQFQRSKTTFKRTKLLFRYRLGSATELNIKWTNFKASGFNSFWIPLATPYTLASLKTKIMTNFANFLLFFLQIKKIKFHLPSLESIQVLMFCKHIWPDRFIPFEVYWIKQPKTKTDMSIVSIFIIIIIIVIIFVLYYIPN